MFNNLIDPGTLPVLIIVGVSAIAKFYFAIRNRSWYSFADGMARLGLTLFYLAAHISTIAGTFDRDQQMWRTVARYSVMAVFLVEIIPWAIRFFIRPKERKP
jgi:hypothetical protein